MTKKAPVKQPPVKQTLSLSFDWCDNPASVTHGQDVALFGAHGDGKEYEVTLSFDSVDCVDEFTDLLACLRMRLAEDEDTGDEDEEAGD